MSEDFANDLHCHSTYSDGTSTPEEIIDLATKLGLMGLSITDHDTVDAYTRAIPYAKEKGIRLVTGVEFSAGLHETSVHILGYGFNPENSIILNFCKRHEERRTKRNQAIMDLLVKHQMPIDEHELRRPIQGIFPKSIGRPHIAQQMVNKGYVQDIKEAFHKYLGDDKPCYIPGEYFSVADTIDIIHQANGVAVLAHPHLINKKRIVHQLMELEFDGIEAYYARFPLDKCTKWINKAQENSWLITGGSDYHGTVKPRNHLGSSWTPRESFEYLESVTLSNLSS